MDYVQVFNDELQSVLRTKPSISKAKMIQITRAAIKGSKFYKHIVQTVEKFISRCRPEYMISGLYVIDSIVRQSRHQFGPDRDVYTARFAKNICITFETLFSNCLPDDKPKIVRVLNLWMKNGVFDSQTIQPLMELSGTTTSKMYPKSPDGNPTERGHSSSYPSQTQSYESLKFNKDLLDFDYDEDDAEEGDETPTEAEPPLSSTLGKIKNKSHRSPSPPEERFYSKRFEQDPILEHRQRVNKNDQSGSDSINNSTRMRSRSRSPPNSSTHLNQSDGTKAASKSEKQAKANEELANLQKLQARQAERAAERDRRCLPKIRDKHLTICSSTLWLGHLPKSISEVDISDAFGEFGTISSIDLVPPRGCAYVCMDRRQDAKKALDESKDLKLKNNYIKMAWAPGKGFQAYRKLKDFWESDVGASFVPYSKIDLTIDFDVLEEGGVIDEDSMSMEMRERREQQAKSKKVNDDIVPQTGLGLPLPPVALLSQPPHYGSNLSVPPPTSFGQGPIPFPPPCIATTSSGGQITVPPPSTHLLGQSVVAGSKETDGMSSPPSIDQQLSMTERQISMVAQQLNQIQQNQISRGLSLQPMPSLPHPTPVFQSSHQPSAMMFDMALGQQMLQNMLDPSLAMFTNNPSIVMTNSQMMVPTNLVSSSPMMGISESFDEHQGGY